MRRAQLVLSPSFYMDKPIHHKFIEIQSDVTQAVDRGIGGEYNEGKLKAERGLRWGISVNGIQFYL